MDEAPGAPGIAARWTSSDKTGVGTALSSVSRVWFTLSHGILNEVYFPRVDQACLRDFGFIVTDGARFFAEEKRDCESVIRQMQDGVPAYRLVNTHRPAEGKPRFRITKHILADPWRDVVLQKIRLESLDGTKFRLFALAAPHLANRGAQNTGWVGDYKGEKMLLASGGGVALALAANVPWGARSVGFVGSSDGWQDLTRHFELTWAHERASDGNVALAGELDLPESGEAILALGFGGSWSSAAWRARASLQADFAQMTEAYSAEWLAWQAKLRPLDGGQTGRNPYRVSTSVLRAHEAPTFMGGFIASLSIPWGATQGDDDLGGYHLVWPRDLVETAGGLLAAGAHGDALRVLAYLRATQEADGHWPQNNWLDGLPYWNGIQMDECAFPILLVDMARRAGALPEPDIGFWPMVRLAAGYLVRNGPITSQDRWEENAGFSPFTLAVEIAALLVAADLAAAAGEPAMAGYLRDTADSWNASIEGWVYARGTDLAREVGVTGYYVRMAPAIPPSTTTRLDTEIRLKNQPDGQAPVLARDLVSPDALALVRFGLRAADDPRILDTIKIIDQRLRIELPAGPCWYRYNGDGYGEHADGAPFDGTGIGRPWPLLTGERAHYYAAAGDWDQAAALLATLENFANGGGLLPEQVWDQADIPSRELWRGRPSGSAMPLVWAHAEHIKLLRSIADRAVFDRPPQTVARYIDGQRDARLQPWRPDFQAESLAPGLALRLDLLSPGRVRWSQDGWATQQEADTTDIGLGIFCCEIPAAGLAPGLLEFTWQGAPARQIFAVTVAA